VLLAVVPAVLMPIAFVPPAALLAVVWAARVAPVFASTVAGFISIFESG
jgi:hypothetical protein